MTHVGGLVGYREAGSFERCYWDTETSGQAASVGGEGRTTAQMRQQSTYDGWDFTAAWGLAPDQNAGYPYLPWRTLWLVRFLAGAGGDVCPSAGVCRGVTQWVADGQDAAPALAAPTSGYAFDQWSDGSVENPRALTSVSADVTLTALFRVLGSLSLAVVDTGGVVQGRGLWDLTGTYPTTVAGHPLTLRAAEDARGNFTGTALIEGLNGGGKGLIDLTVPVKGRVGSFGGALVVKLAMKGADSTGRVRVALSMALALDADARQLRGPVRGSIRTAAATTRVADSLTLDLPATMDGTWTLLFELITQGKASSGTALLTLANGVDVLFTAKGRSSGQALVLSLSAASSDPAAKGMRIRTTMTPLDDEWARLDAFSATGYGQALRW